MSTISDWAIVTATLVGPVLAIQAQKWIERRNEMSGRKTAIFTTLMATRAARLSADHVRSLNAIDLTFYGGFRFGKNIRSNNEQLVLDAWKEYMDHLCSPIPDGHGVIDAFIATRDELFINLLAAIAKERRYRFDRVLLKKGAYSPTAHGQVEAAQIEALKGAADILTGRQPLRVTPILPVITNDQPPE
ncbi:DUF6680 family protein [Burkholderia gladioli]|uniref:DUF6680 family protein n=1 Tax=Burkholderia gladioli TaxID=28095 RepID=UPI003F79CA95